MADRVGHDSVTDERILCFAQDDSSGVHGDSVSAHDDVPDDPGSIGVVCDDNRRMIRGRSGLRWGELVGHQDRRRG